MESTKTASSLSDYFEFPIVLTQHDVAKVLRTVSAAHVAPIPGAPFSYRDAAETQKILSFRNYPSHERAHSQ